MNKKVTDKIVIVNTKDDESRREMLILKRKKDLFKVLQAEDRLEAQYSLYLNNLSSAMKNSMDKISDSLYELKRYYALVDDLNKKEYSMEQVEEIKDTMNINYLADLIKDDNNVSERFKEIVSNNRNKLFDSWKKYVEESANG